MLRMKMQSGEFPASLYRVVDDISSRYGNQTIRATTRCAWQIHGILKSDLTLNLPKVLILVRIVL